MFSIVTVKMTIKEDRDLRNAAKKCLAGELRSKLLEELLKKGLGLTEVEEFVSKEKRKLKKGDGTDFKGFKKHREIVKKIMKEKVRDSKGECISLRRDKFRCLKILETRLRHNKDEFERIKREVRQNCVKLKTKIVRKNEGKVKFLQDKYGVQEVKVRSGLNDEELKKYGHCKSSA